MTSLRKHKKVPCTTHTEERLKFYCTSHNSIVCCICVVKQHRHCDEILTFPEAIERFKQEGKTLVKAIENQINAVGLVIATKNTELISLGTNVAESKSEISEICEQLHDVINNKKEELLGHVDELAEEEAENARSGIERLNKMLVSAGNLKHHATHVFDKKSAFDIIQTMITVQDMYSDIKETTEDVKTKRTRCISFQQSDEVHRIFECFQTLGFITLNESESVNTRPIEGQRLKFNSMFGETEESTEDVNAESQEHVTVIEDEYIDTKNKTTDMSLTANLDDLEIINEPTDTIELETVTGFHTVDHGKPCWLYGIAFITSDQLAVTDAAHNSIQVFDVNGTLVCETSVPFTPWDITRVGNGCVAVSTTGSESINIFKLDNDVLSLVQTIRAGYDCVCLSYSEKIFTVGTRSGVIIVTENGKLKEEINTYSNDGETMRRINFVTTDTTSSHLFLTSTWRNEVVTINNEGQRWWTLHGEGLYPRGVVWFKNRLFVCNKTPGQILIVDESGKIVREIGSDKLELPYAIDHHPTGYQVAVTQWDEKIDASRSRFVNILTYTGSG